MHDPHGYAGGEGVEQPAFSIPPLTRTPTKVTAKVLIFRRLLRKYRTDVRTLG